MKRKHFNKKTKIIGFFLFLALTLGIHFFDDYMASWGKWGLIPEAILTGIWLALGLYLLGYQPEHENSKKQDDHVPDDTK